MAIFSRLLLIAAIVSFAVGAPLRATSPTVLWSNRGLVKGKGQEISELTTANNLQQYIDSTLQPELYMIFIEPKLETTQFYALSNSQEMTNDVPTFKNLMQLIEVSQSSLVLPYTLGEDSKIASTVVSKLYDDLITMNPDMAVIVAAKADTTLLRSKKNVQRTTVQELIQSANAAWNVLNNGVADLVVVSLDEASSNDMFQQHDEIIGKLSAAVSSAPYVAIYTAEEASFPTHIMTDFADTDNGLHAFEERNPQELVESGSSNWPDEAVEGLIISIPFLIILFIGIRCTFGVQSDLKFDGEKQKKFL